MGYLLYSYLITLLSKFSTLKYCDECSNLVLHFSVCVFADLVSRGINGARADVGGAHLAAVGVTLDDAVLAGIAAGAA